MRICSLLPSATEIAFALGLGDAVVGVTHECDYPAEAQKKPCVVKSAVDAEKNPSGQIDALVREHLKAGRSLYSIDLPRFREARPDLILTQGLCEVCAIDYREVEAVAKLFSTPPQILSLNPNSLDDVLSDIARVGRAAGKAAAAQGLCRSLEKRINAITTRTRNVKRRPRIACLEWLDPLYAAGHWIPEMVAMAGGTDGLGRGGEPSQAAAWERVLEWDPEIVIVMPCGFTVERSLGEWPLLQSLPGWNNLRAVREGRVYVVDGHAYFNRSGPRLVDGLEILAGIIHPDIFFETVPDGAVQRVV